MEIPYFICLLAKNKLVRSTVNARSVSDIDLQGLVCTQLKENLLEISDFELSCEEYFKSVSILVTRYGTMIDLVSPDAKYFEDSAYYFNIHTSGRLRRSPHLVDTENRFTKSKRVGNFELFSGSLQATVFKTASYGSKIMFFYKKTNLAM